MCGRIRFSGKKATRSKFRKTIKLIVFDFDGVLTDNRVLVFQDGREAVFCSRSDGLAFDLFRAANLRTLILSTEVNPVVSARARKLRTAVLQGREDKRSTLIDYCAKHQILLHQVAYVGNDVNDLAAMECVGLPICPSDAHRTIKRISKHVLRSKGGAGVARELAETFFGLDHRQTLDNAKTIK